MKSAQSLLVQLVQNDSPNPEVRFLLALCMGEFEPLHENPEASQTAVALLSELVEENPSVSRYRSELCMTYRKMANRVSTGSN